MVSIRWLRDSRKYKILHEGVKDQVSREDNGNDKGPVKTLSAPWTVSSIWILFTALETPDDGHLVSQDFFSCAVCNTEVLALKQQTLLNFFHDDSVKFTA